ncbi:MAG: hypothetical protein AAB255_05070 [Bacteroidota bacterium]
MSSEKKSEIEIAKEKYEANISVLWEQLREIGNLVSLLRSENYSLREQLLKSEEVISAERNESLIQKSELQKLREQAMMITDKFNNSVVIDSDEKQSLRLQVEEMIVKINSHL